MKKFYLKHWTVAGWVIFHSILLAGPLFAGISAKPTVTEKVMEPGATEEGIYELTNNGETKIDVSVDLEDWMQRMFGQKDAMEVGQWLTVDPSKVTVEPGQTVQIKYRVTAPQEFTNEKVAQVFFTYSDTVNLTSRMGLIFYLSPKNTAALKASITQFLAQPAFEEGKEPRLLSYFVMQNDSNVHIRPRGIVSIMDQSGTPVREILVDNVPGIYPGKSFTWNHYGELKDLPFGAYKAKLTLDYGYLYSQEAVMEAPADLNWEKPPQAAAPVEPEAKTP